MGHGKAVRGSYTDFNANSSNNNMCGRGSQQSSALHKHSGCARHRRTSSPGTLDRPLCGCRSSGEWYSEVKAIYIGDIGTAPNDTTSAI